MYKALGSPLGTEGGRGTGIRYSVLVYELMVAGGTLYGAAMSRPCRLGLVLDRELTSVDHQVEVACELHRPGRDIVEGLFDAPVAADVQGKSILVAYKQSWGEAQVTHASVNGVTQSYVNYAPDGHFGLLTHDGTPLPGAAMWVKRWSNPQNAGAHTFGDPTTSSRLADPRLRTNQMMDASSFSSSTTSTADRETTGVISFRRLPAAATGTATFGASRAATGNGSNRAVVLSHGGTTVTIDASTDAASNQVSLAFTVAGDGSLDFDIANAAGHANGYFAAVILDFDGAT